MNWEWGNKDYFSNCETLQAEYLKVDKLKSSTISWGCTHYLMFIFIELFYLLCTQGLSLFLYTFVQYHKYLGPVLKKVHFKELYPVLVTTIGYWVCQGYLIQKWRGRLTKPSIRTQITFKNILSMNWPNAADCSLSSNLSEKHLSRANLG